MSVLQQHWNHVSLSMMSLQSEFVVDEPRIEVPGDEVWMANDALMERNCRLHPFNVEFIQCSSGSLQSFFAIAAVAD